MRGPSSLMTVHSDVVPSAQRDLHAQLPVARRVRPDDPARSLGEVDRADARRREVRPLVLAEELVGGLDVVLLERGQEDARDLLAPAPRASP